MGRPITALNGTAHLSQANHWQRWNLEARIHAGKEKEKMLKGLFVYI